ncbi:MAG: metal ABC transporter solute-binding protein, Zn/Mn family [Akkermansiaceae bacterium]
MLKKVGVVALSMLVVLGVLVWMLAREEANQKQSSARSDALSVVSTTTMVTDMVRAIGGDRIHVESMMGAKVDPHSYQVTFSDTAALKKADLVFYSGHHLEGKMQDVLEKRAANTGGVYAVTDGIPDELLLKPQEQFEGYYDPHLWGNPELWAYCVPVVVEALIKADPEGEAQYRARGEAYHASILALHEWATQRIAEVPAKQRVLVTSHDAFFYFGKAYGFEVRGLQGVSTNSESGLKDRAELVEFIQDRKLKAIFPESSVNAKGIKAVASEAGVVVSEHELFSDAMGELGDTVTLHGETYDKGTYIGMIKHNVNTIVDGLKN